MTDKTDYHSELKKIGSGFSSLFKMGLSEIKRGIDFAASAVMDSKSSEREEPVVKEAPFPDKVDPWATEPAAEREPAKTPEVIYIQPEPAPEPLTREVVEELVGPLAEASADKSVAEPASGITEAAKKAKALQGYVADQMDDGIVAAILSCEKFRKVRHVVSPDLYEGASAVVYSALSVDAIDEGFRWKFAGIACQEGPGGHIMDLDVQRIIEKSSRKELFKTEAEAYRAGLEKLVESVHGEYDLHIMVEGAYARNKLSEIRRKQIANVAVTGVWGSLADALADRHLFIQPLYRGSDSYKAFFDK